jgi:phage tail-like protein
MARSASVDPLERFRFEVRWSNDGASEGTALVRLGFHDIQMPKRSTTKISYREGLDPDVNQLAAGLSSMEDIVMSRGVIIEDANGEFYKWMSAVHRPTSGHVGRDALGARGVAALNNYKKEVVIKLLDREGNVARQWVLYNAFPINFVPASDLNAGEDGDKAMEQLTLAYEDFKEMAIAGNAEKPVSGGY